MKLFYICFVFLLSICQVRPEASPLLRVPDISDIKGDISPLHEVRAFQLKGCRVWWVNYRLMRRDFPALAQTTNGEIQSFLQNLCLINEKQLALAGFRNSNFQIDTSLSQIVYQTDYHVRGAMIPTQLGLIDGKGMGHGSALWIEKGKGYNELLNRFHEVSETDPAGRGSEIDRLRDLSHSDGLMSGPEAVAELFSAFGNQEAFRRQGLLFRSVMPYALIRYPFDILRSRGRRYSAVLYLRQLNFNRSHAADPPQGIIRGSYHQATAYDPFLLADFGVSAILEESLRARFFSPNYIAPTTHADKVKVSGAMPRSSRLASKMSLRLDQLNEDQTQTAIDLVLDHLIGQVDQANPWIRYFDQLFDPTIEIYLSAGGGGYVDRYRESFNSLMNHDLASPFFTRIEEIYSRNPQDGQETYLAYWSRVQNIRNIALLNHFRFFVTSFKEDPWTSARFLSHLRRISGFISRGEVLEWIERRQSELNHVKGAGLSCRAALYKLAH
ncbi:MAG: hypothetical protein IPK68_03720 [Bdellovibrionales bacterium]|nr:hypothetical protein [Bdellovibrionales bacterium]